MSIYPSTASVFPCSACMVATLFVLSLITRSYSPARHIIACAKSIWISSGGVWGLHMYALGNVDVASIVIAWSMCLFAGFEVFDTVTCLLFSSRWEWDTLVLHIPHALFAYHIIETFSESYIVLGGVLSMQEVSSIVLNAILFRRDYAYFDDEILCLVFARTFFASHIVVVPCVSLWRICFGHATSIEIFGITLTMIMQLRWAANPRMRRWMSGRVR